MMVIKMEIINKVEGLIFKQVLHYPLIQVVENKTVIINDRCTFEMNKLNHLFFILITDYFYFFYAITFNSNNKISIFFNSKVNSR